MQFRWRFDAQRQELHTPFGHTIAVREIARWLQDQTHARHDLTGPWAGWRVRGRWLHGPGGFKTTPEALRHPLRIEHKSGFGEGSVSPKE